MKTLKLYVSSIIMLLMVFGPSISANAVLVDNGDGTITDTDTGLMWLQDANYAMTSGYDVDGLMNWDAAMSWASSLSYAGYDDWRLPSALNSDGSGPCSFTYNCTDSEMGHIYYTELGNSPAGPLTNTGLFINLQADQYWSNTLHSVNPDGAYNFNFNDGYQRSNGKNYSYLNAMAVRVVPEPISSILFATGGTLLVGRRFIRRINKA